MLKDFTKEKFDIIIQAGQSNSEGYGVGPVDEPYQPRDDVWYLNGDFTISPAAERVTGNEIHGTFALPFAADYINAGLLKEGRKLLILRTAEGGTGFLTGERGMSDRLYLRMMKMIRTALDMNPENRLVCMLWHQGENEVEKKASFDVHYENLSTLVRSVQDEFNAHDVPFIAGDFVQGWKAINEEACVPVVEAGRAVCKECKRGAFVETDGLKSNIDELLRKTCGWEDPIHFSRKSLYTLGKRYFDAFAELIK